MPPVERSWIVTSVARLAGSFPEVGNRNFMRTSRRACDIRLGSRWAWIVIWSARAEALDRPDGVNISFACLQP